MPTVVLVALIPAVGGLVGIVLKHALDGRRDARIARAAAYPELVLVMQAYTKLALTDGRSEAANAADRAARERVIRLRGVGSRRARETANAWLLAVQ